MACRCAERKTALLSAAVAVRQGNVGGAVKDVHFVARSMIEDAAYQASARLSLVRATMGRGIRR
jgi:hypothetical protein